MRKLPPSSNIWSMHVTYPHLLLFHTSAEEDMARKWSPEKEQRLVEAHVELGNKWVLIANRIPGHHRDDEVKVGTAVPPYYRYLAGYG